MEHIITISVLSVALPFLTVQAVRFWGWVEYKVTGQVGGLAQAESERSGITVR